MLNKESYFSETKCLIASSRLPLGLNGLVGCSKIIVSGFVLILSRACRIALSVDAVSLDRLSGRFITYAPLSKDTLAISLSSVVT